MLKRISVEQLTVGMHLKEFCGSWMEHPFWRSGFVITDPKDIKTICASSIKEVWIDVSKGVDVAVGVEAVTEEEVDARVEAQLQGVVATPRQITPVSMEEEIQRAAKICYESKKAVISMFEEARMGRAVETGGAKKLVEEITDSVTRNPGALISLARLKSVDDYT